MHHLETKWTRLGRDLSSPPQPDLTRRASKAIEVDSAWPWPPAVLHLLALLLQVTGVQQKLGVWNEAALRVKVGTCPAPGLQGGWTSGCPATAVLSPWPLQPLSRWSRVTESFP